MGIIASVITGLIILGSGIGLGDRHQDQGRLVFTGTKIGGRRCEVS